MIRIFDTTCCLALRQHCCVVAPHWLGMIFCPVFLLIPLYLFFCRFWCLHSVRFPGCSVPGLFLNVTFSLTEISLYLCWRGLPLMLLVCFISWLVLLLYLVLYQFTFRQWFYLIFMSWTVFNISFHCPFLFSQITLRDFFIFSLRSLSIFISANLKFLSFASNILHLSVIF